MPPDSVPAKGVLFTAFEPSGDDHASAVIEELRRRHPGLPIYAWGGPKMERAGATLIERTGEAAVMGMPGLSKILEHRRINARIKAWLARGLAAVHVPVDSPGANFPICKLTRRAGLKIVHLVAPQVWAWGSWRTGKLRRRTDLVLCLLPFEEDWFLSRGVPAKFIGHPLFDHPLDVGALDRAAAAMPGGVPKIAFMPGSRPGEMSSCFPILLDAFRRLRKDFPQAAGVVAATSPATAERLRGMAEERGGGWPDGLTMVAGDTDAVIRWCDFALSVSGTVTLQIAKQRKPMVAVYRPNPWMYYFIGRWIVSTELFTLPNLIAGRKILPELIPHFGDGEELALEIIKLMRRTGYAEDQREGLEAVCRRFAGFSAATDAAEAIERVLRLGRAGVQVTPTVSKHPVPAPGDAAALRAREREAKAV